MDNGYVLKDGVPEYVGPIIAALESQRKLNETWQRMFEAYTAEVGLLWEDNATLRDELHAVANRLENLTRAITTSPAEVAAAIVNDANRETLREVFTCRLNPGCNVSRPHIHDDDGAVIYVEDEATADDQLRQRALAVGLRRARGQS